MRFVADEDFDADIIRGVVRRQPDLDIVRIQDVGLAGAVDPVVLEWAAGQSRVLLSHDVSTIGVHAYDRVLAGEAMPGVILVGQNVAIAVAIEDILLIANCSLEGELDGHIVHVPLRR